MGLITAGLAVWHLEKKVWNSRNRSHPGIFSSTELSFYNSRLPPDDPLLYQPNWRSKDLRFMYKTEWLMHYQSYLYLSILFKLQLSRQLRWLLASALWLTSFRCHLCSCSRCSWIPRGNVVLCNFTEWDSGPLTSHIEYQHLLVFLNPTVIPHSCHWTRCHTTRCQPASSSSCSRRCHWCRLLSKKSAKLQVR